MRKSKYPFLILPFLFFFTSLSLSAQEVNFESRNFIQFEDYLKIIHKLNSQESEYFLLGWNREEWSANHWEITDSTLLFYSHGQKLIEQQNWKDYTSPKLKRDLFKYDLIHTDSISLHIRQEYLDEWKNTSQTEYFFDENAKLIKVISNISDTITQQWKNDRQILYDYTPEGQPLKESIFIWDGSDWQLSYIRIFNYNSNGNIIENATLEVNSVDTSKGARFLYKYDDSNNLITEKWQLGSISDPDKWMNSIRRTWQYDSLNRQTIETFESWEQSDSSWMYLGRYLYSYLDKYQVDKVIQYWINFDWQNTLLYHYEYDEKGNNPLTLIHSWKEEAWVPSLKRTKEYNEEGFITLDLTQDVEGKDLINFFRTRYFYSVFTASKEVSLPEITFFVFPNPTSGQINIKWPEGNMDHGLILLFDLQGRLIFSQKNGLQQLESLILPDLPSGTYLLKITDGKKWGIQKIQIVN